MIERFAFLLFTAFALSALVVAFKRARDAGAREEREHNAAENAARLERQNAVVNRPVTDDELEKSLKDGSF